MAINIPINAQLNQQELSQEIKQVEQAFNELGKVAEQAGRIKFAPISKLSLEDAKRMRQEFDAMVRMSPGLRRTLQQSGQGGMSFDQVDWGKVWTDPNQRASHAHTMVSHLGPDQIKAMLNRHRGNGDEDTGGNQPPVTGQRNTWKRAAGGAVAGIAGGAASQLGGLAGGVASGALAGGMAGGLLGAALGGFTGAITSLLGSMGEARDLAISLDALKRNLGDVNVKFTDLQQTTRGLADDYSLTDAEATTLTARYARLSGSSKDTVALGQETGVGVGFSRAFGLEPGAGVDFFGQMRGLGVTRNADDSKRLALMIGESVAKAGDLPRMADVLAGLSQYMEASGRSLNNAGAGGWLSSMAGLERLGIAGMSPANAANVIGSIDGSVRQGGLSEAGRNFMSGVLQREQGLNPVQAMVQLEGGAFGTGRSAFGPDSAASRFYSRFGGGTRVANWSSDTTNISMLQRQLEQTYAGRPDLMSDAFANTFGTTRTQAMAWLASDPVQNDAMAKRLGRLGVDMRSVNADGISRISQIEANGDLSDGEKDRQALDAATQHQEKTEGSEARKAAIDGGNAMVRLASEGLPMISSIQAAVLKIAGLDPQSMQQRAAQTHYDEVMDDIKLRLGSARDTARKDYEAITPFYKRLTGIGLTDDQQFAKDRLDAAESDYSEAQQAAIAQLNGDKVRAGSSLPGTVSAASPEVLARALEKDRKFGFQDGTTAGLIMQESSFRSDAVSKAGAKGLLQIMPSNVDALSSKAGRQLDPTNTEDAFYMYDQLMQERKQRYGNDTDRMLKSYNAGYDESRWDNPETRDYVPAIERQRQRMAQQNASMKHNVAVDIVLRDGQGRPMPGAQINTRVGAPTVSGTNY